MDKVTACIDELPALFEALAARDMKKIVEIAKKISELEHKADLTKNDIRNHLPKSLFMPINRNDFLEILALQDALADKAEDIGNSIALKELEGYEDIKSDFEPFWKKNIETFSQTKSIIKEFNELLESSFGGIEAQKVKEMVEKVAYLEHEVDIMQLNLLKELYELGDRLKHTTFHLWHILIIEIAAISNLSEKLANRIRMILEIT